MVGTTHHSTDRATVGDYYRSALGTGVLPKGKHTMAQPVPQPVRQSAGHIRPGQARVDINVEAAEVR